MPPQGDGPSIRVESDGVKLGWHVMAMLAAAGLGLYIASVISPLKETAKDNREAISAMEEQMVAYEKRIDSLSTQVTLLERELQYNHTPVARAGRDANPHP